MTADALVPPARREEIRRLFALLRRPGARHDPSARRRADQLGAELIALCAGPPAPATAVLTAREVDVLAHAAVGARNGEVAAHLGISAETVKSYLRSAMVKLGVHSRHAAVHAAREIGAIP